MSQTTDFTSFVTEHPNYFPGQYLLEEDFELQHKYLSDRQRYRNQSLHVSGIIEGLEVEIVTGKQEVKILSGSAIDSQGNLIVLKEDEPFIEFNSIANGELYIKYEEQKQNLQQTTKDTETRIVEKAVIEFAAKTPDGSVKLANLQISAGSVSFDTNNDRQYSGISLPNSNSKTLTLRSGGNGNPNLAVLTGSLEIDGDLTVDGTGTSSFAGSLNIDKTLTVKDISTNENQQNEESTIDIDGKQIVFTTDDISDNLKLQLSEGYGLGINYFTLFYTAGIHSWRDDQNNERMLLNTAPGAGLTVKGTGTSSFAGSLNIDGGLTVKGTGDSSFAGSLNIDGELTVEGTGTSSFKGSLNIDKTLTVKDSLTIQNQQNEESTINIDGKQIVFTSDDVSDYLRLELAPDYGLGIKSNVLFYAAYGRHSWRDEKYIERMSLTTASDGGLTVTGTGTSSFAGNLNIDKTLTVKDSLTIQKSQASESKIDIDDQQIVFTSKDATDQLKLQLWKGFGLGINSNTLFYRANNNHSWRDNNNIERMSLTYNEGFTTAEGTESYSFTVNVEHVYLPGHIYLKEHGNGNIAYLQARDEEKKQDISLQLRTQKGDGNSRTITDAMMITPDGNVGIGTNDPVNFKLNVQGSQYLKDSLTIGGGQINIHGNQKIVFTDDGKTNSVKLQLWTQHVLGIDNFSLFYTASGTHSWRDHNNTERMSLGTASNGGLTVKGTGNSSFAGSLEIDGGLTVKGTTQLLYQEPWQAADLRFDWDNVDVKNKAGYFKDSLGIVHLRGKVTRKKYEKDSPLNKIIFVLPGDYKPSATEIHAVKTSQDAVGQVDINLSGSIVFALEQRDLTWLSLDGITFRAA